MKKEIMTLRVARAGVSTTVDSIEKRKSQTGKFALVIDDDRSVRRVFSKGLQVGGFKVDTAETGKEALDKLRDRVYDVTLIDVGLPDMDGLDLLNAMQATSPDTTKIVITGYATTEGGIKALEKGADAYLAKPVRRKELLLIIEKSLGKKKRQRERSKNSGENEKK